VVFSKRVDDLQLRAGAKVTVNIFGGVLSKQLSKLGVTEKEIERIGTLQLEDREHVITFLSAQGVLKKSGIQKRVVRV
jgi:hypothetical protein